MVKNMESGKNMAHILPVAGGGHGVGTQVAIASHH